MLIKKDFKGNETTGLYEWDAIQQPVLVTNKNTYTYYDEKFIHTFEQIKAGTYIEIEEYGTGNFMVINEVAIKHYGNVYKSIIRHCPFTLKHQFTDQYSGTKGQLTEYPCYFLGQGYSLTSSQVFSFITSSEIFAFLQGNEYTRSLTEQTRFIKFSKAWKVYGIDKTQDGILTWYCKEDTLDYEHDDVANEIAYNV